MAMDSSRVEPLEQRSGCAEETGSAYEGTEQWSRDIEPCGMHCNPTVLLARYFQSVLLSKTVGCIGAVLHPHAEATASEDDRSIDLGLAVARIGIDQIASGCFSEWQQSLRRSEGTAKWRAAREPLMRPCVLAQDPILRECGFWECDNYFPVRKAEAQMADLTNRQSAD